jgi:phage baseplate assembly protein W
VSDFPDLDDWWQSTLETVEPTLSGAGITAAWWSFAIGADAIVTNKDDIEQCIKIISTTPRGTDPHRPTFASNVYEYIDKPIPQATPYVIQELTGAVRKWEPRVQLDSLKVTPYSPNISGVSVQAEWSIPGSVVAGLLNITVPRAAA